MRTIKWWWFVCLLLKQADEAIGRFTVAQPTVNVPEGFEDYLLVNKNYNLHAHDKHDANEEVMNIVEFIHSVHLFDCILLTPTTVAWERRLAASVCDSVCLSAW